MIRVAIYCRVSTDFDVSLKSLENQILAYIDLVQNNPDWHLQGIYSDVDTPYGQNAKIP